MPDCPIALTIAGSDCSAGAGMQADLKTFQHFGVFGMTAVTCVVAETSKTVRSVHPVAPAILQDQLQLILSSFPVRAIKTGMLFSKPHVVAVSEILAKHQDIPLVVDPVMVASTGDALLNKDAVAAYKDRLLPLAKLITPNLDEANVLHGKTITDENGMQEAADYLGKTYDSAVLLKGGHLESTECADYLWTHGEDHWFRSPRIDTPAGHGTGCTLAAAVTAGLAEGKSLVEAVEQAKSYLSRTLEQSLKLGEESFLNQGTTFSRQC